MLPQKFFQISGLRNAISYVCNTRENAIVSCLIYISSVIGRVQ